MISIVRNLPKDSALMRSMVGADAEWGLSEQLLALIGDALNAANWQRGAGKRADYPRPIPRPGVGEDTKTSYGKDAIPLEDMAAWLGWPEPSLN